MNASTDPLIAISDSSGIVSGGTSARIAGSAAYASAVPTAPAASASSRLSVSNCCTSRPRPAPSAARTVISRCRAAALESIRFETFAHAISSSTDTAPNRTQMSFWMPLGNVCLKESRPTRHWSGN